MKKNKSDYQEYAVDPAQRLVDEIERLNKLKLASLIAIAKDIKYKPKAMQKIMRDNNLKIDDLNDPMQKLAFTFYSELCGLASDVKAYEAQYGEIKDRSWRK